MRVVDLFCGAGGFSSGMQQAGHHVVAAIDYDKDALAVHFANAGLSRYRRGLFNMLRVAAREANTKGVRRHDNLTRVLATAPEIAELNPEIIVGGPPCQPWSKSGKKRGDADPLAKLTEAFGIIVATARPHYFVMENVPEISGSRVYRRMKHIVRRSGYGLTEMKVDANEYGSAQKRERFLCVGALGEVDGWFSDYMAAAKSAAPLTVADVLPDFGVMLYRKGRRWAPKEPHRVPRPRRSEGKKQKESKGYQLREADKRVLAKADQSFKAYWRYPGGKSSSGIRRTDEPIPTIIKSSGGGVGNNYRRRKNDIINLRNLPVLSLDELSLLSGFPAGWNWQPSREPSFEKKIRNGKKASSPASMLANAVPPTLAKAVGQCLTAHSRKAIPNMARSEWRIPTAYVEWLTRTANLADEIIAQQLSDLSEAKNFVGGHNLPTTRAELIAFDKVPAIAYGKIPPERRTAMRGALANFAEWESNSNRYPTRQKMAQLMKTAPYLRKYPMPLRAELATLELDQEYLEASVEYQEETREKVITLFRNGDPTPYWSACVNPDFRYYDPPEDNYNPPPPSLRQRVAVRRKIQQSDGARSL